MGTPKINGYVSLEEIDEYNAKVDFFRLLNGRKRPYAKDPFFYFELPNIDEFEWTDRHEAALIFSIFPTKGEKGVNERRHFQRTMGLRTWIGQICNREEEYALWLSCNPDAKISQKKIAEIVDASPHSVVSQLAKTRVKLEDIYKYMLLVEKVKTEARERGVSLNDLPVQLYFGQSAVGKKLTKLGVHTMSSLRRRTKLELRSSGFSEADIKRIQVMLDKHGWSLR